MYKSLMLCTPDHSSSSEGVALPDYILTSLHMNMNTLYINVRVNTFLFFLNITEPTNKESEAHIYIQRSGNN